jgi:hypothetical protein
MESFACFTARTTPFQTDSVPNELTFGLPTSLASIFHDGTVWGWSAPVASRLF